MLSSGTSTARKPRLVPAAILSSPSTPRRKLVGAFQNKGRTGRPQGRPYEVNVHDFPSQAEGKAIPYGTYDVLQDRAVVNVGISHDTAEFAVESIRRWWRMD